MIYPSYESDELAIQDLSKVIKYYNPCDIYKDYKAVANNLFKLGMFASKWPNTINAKIFLHHIDRLGRNFSFLDISKYSSKCCYGNEDVTFFIRSYREDFCWLELCISSIIFFAPESAITLCIEECDAELLPEINSKVKVVKEESFCKGSIQQKYSKLTADFHCDSEFIIFIDSDSALVKPFNISEWLYNDRPILEYTSFNEINHWYKTNRIQGENPEFWRKGVSAAVGYNVELEFSRRLEKIYKKSWLAKMRDNIERVHSTSFKNFMASQRGMKEISDPSDSLYFSDFNYMGAYLWKFEHEHVAWLSTEVLDFWTRNLMAVQFHSHTMVEINNSQKHINDVPKDFMKFVYHSRKKFPNSAQEDIEKKYSELRAKYRY